MKTILTRMKTLVRENNSAGQTLEYVKHVEVIHPEISIIDINQSVTPSIFLAPGRTIESWEASQRKIAEHRVVASLMMYYTQRELNMIGDESRGLNGKGLFDFENDFMTIFRGHRLAVDGVNYLDKPLEIEDIDRFPTEVDENVFVITSRITLFCTRLFFQETLPGNI